MERKARRWQLTYTVVIFLIQLTYGICTSILGPGLVDFSYIYGVSLEKVSYSVSLVSTGYLFGSCIGWTYRWLNRQLLMVVFTTLFALTTAAMPFCHSVLLFFVASTLNGVGSGAWDSTSSAWLVEMWPDVQSAPVLQAVQFMYGLGATLAPIIAAPFVHGNNNATLNYTFTGPQRQRYLAAPYGAVGLAHAVLAAVLAVIYFIKPYRKSDYAEADESEPCLEVEAIEGEEANTDRTQVSYRYWRLTLLGLALAFYSATEGTYTNFATALWINANTTTNTFSPSDSAHLLSILFAVYTLGRLISAFITIKLNPGYLLAYHYLMMLGSFALLYFARNSHLLVYIGVVLLGYGFSATWPGLLGFTEQHAKLTERVASVFSLLSGLAQLATPLMLAPFLDTAPLMLFAVEIAACSLSFTCFIIANLIIRLHPPSYRTLTNHVDSVRVINS